MFVGVGVSLVKPLVQKANMCLLLVVVCGGLFFVAVLFGSAAIVVALMLCVLKFGKQDAPFCCAHMFVHCWELMASPSSLAAGKSVSVVPLAPGSSSAAAPSATAKLLPLGDQVVIDQVGWDLF